MKQRRILRITALLLAVSLLLGLTAAAQQSGQTDASLILQYSIDDTWARPALLFSVREGLLRGMPDGTLHPTDKALRAEVAAILMRILRTDERTDLSGYTDTAASAWYYDELSRAVAAGIFNGTAADKLSPTRRITRQETFTAIARMLGLYIENDAYLSRFKDASAIADWAKPYIAALSEAGFLNGNEKGLLDPESNINRQELAQVFFNIFGSMLQSVPEQYSGKMLAVNADTIPAGTRIDGDLLLSGSGAELTLENVTVTGRLVLQGSASLQLTVKNSSFGALVLCRPTQLTAENLTGTVLAKKESTFIGSFTDLQTYADAVLRGSCERFDVCGGNLLVEPESSVQTLTARSSAIGSRLTIDGTVQAAYLRAEKVRALGTGSIGAAYITKFDCAVNCAFGSRETSVDAGVSDVRAIRTDSAIPSDSSPAAEIAVRFTDVNITSGFQSDGARKCRVIWLVNNRPVCVRENFLLTEGATDSLYIDFDEYMDEMAAVPVKVCVAYEDETSISSFRVRLNNMIYDAAANVQTGHVKATVKYDTGLYAKCYGYLSGWKQTVKAGTQVSYHAYWGTSFAYIWLPDGTAGWLNYSAISISGEPAYTTVDYSDAVKECWVNEIKGYSSTSKYLLWISLWTQRVNVFEGSKGNWTLIHSYPAATGSNYTPTMLEETTIRYKTPRWNFGVYYVHHVTVIDDGGRAFHSRTYTPDGSLLDATMGRPVSHGCIRMQDEACTWIYNNAPVGTTVIVW